MIIANPLDWGVGEQPTRLFNDFKPAPDARLAARHGTDSAPLKVHYSDGFEPEELNLSSWWTPLTQTMVMTRKAPNPKMAGLAQFLVTCRPEQAGQWQLVFQAPT